MTPQSARRELPLGASTLDSTGRVDVRTEIALIDLARAEGQEVAEEMRRRLAAEMEAVRRPYRDDPWPWIMVAGAVLIGGIVVVAIRLPEILHALGYGSS
jgi:hypothetical protein